MVKRVIREVLTEKKVYRSKEEKVVSHVAFRPSDKGDSRGKDPEVGTELAFLKNSGGEGQ